MRKQIRALPSACTRIAAAGLVACTVALVGCSPEPTRVMSFNVLCSVCDVQNYAPWRERLGSLGDIFERHDPDLLGTQELLLFRDVEELRQRLPDHEVVYVDVGSADASGALAFGDEVSVGEAQALSYPDAMIFYRRGRYEVLDSGTYWLSERPNVSPFPAWDPLSLPRIVIWAHLADTVNGTELIFINTHFDNNGGNKVPSANLFMDQAVLGAGLPMIMTGDFNSKPDSPSYEILAQGNDGPGGFALANTFDSAPAPRSDSNTGLDETYGCGDMGPGDFPECRIDHIFVAGNGAWQVKDWVVDLWQYGDEPNFPSDHRAIQAEVELL